MNAASTFLLEVGTTSGRREAAFGRRRHWVTVAAPLETMPLLVRAGSILPTGPVKQYAAETSSEPVRLTVVYPGGRWEFSTVRR